MTSVSLPNLNQTGTNEWEDVEGNDRALRDFLNSTGVGVYQAGSISNAAVASNAAIAHSKLASATAGYVLLGNSSNVPTATQVTGDVTISSAGVTAITALAIVNADVNASAAIAYSKLNLTGAVLNADLAGSITDAKLASPNNGTLKTIFSANCFIADVGGGNPTGDVYILGSSGGSYGARHEGVDHAIGSNDQAPAIFYFTSGDYSVGGLTQKFKLRAQVGCNGTAPGVDITVKLVPVTVGAAADNLRYTAGTTVSGSSVTLATTAATSTFVQDVATDFTVPSNGMYMLVANVGTGGLNGGSAISVHAQLQTRST